MPYTVYIGVKCRAIALWCAVDEVVQVAWKCRWTWHQRRNDNSEMEQHVASMNLATKCPHGLEHDGKLIYWACVKVWRRTASTGLSPPLSPILRFLNKNMNPPVLSVLATTVAGRKPGIILLDAGLTVVSTGWNLWTLSLTRPLWL